MSASSISVSAENARWYVRARNRVTGPFDLDRLKVLRQRGQLAAFHEVSTNRVDWIRAGALTEVFSAPASAGGIGVMSVSTSKTAEPASWYYARGGASHGPVPLSQVRELFDHGALGPDSLVWREGMPTWLAARDVAELGAGVGEGRTGAMPPPTAGKPGVGRRAWAIAAIVVFLLGSVVVLTTAALTWPMWRGPLLAAFAGKTDEAASAVDPVSDDSPAPAPVVAPAPAVVTKVPAPKPADATPDKTDDSAPPITAKPAEPVEDPPPAAKPEDGAPEPAPGTAFGPNARPAPAPGGGPEVAGQGDGQIRSLDDEKALQKAVGFVVCGWRFVTREGVSKEVPESTGTAFVVSPDGLLLTNKHVVEHAAQRLRMSPEARINDLCGVIREALGPNVRVDPRLFRKVDAVIWVFLGDAESMKVANVLHVSDDYDVAVLSLPRPDRRMPYFRLSPANAPPARGESVAALGYPGASRIALSDDEELLDARRLGKGSRITAYYKPTDFEFTETKGSISRVTRRADGKTWIQHEASINPGNSGGPLVRPNGAVVGINTALNREAQGIFFALEIRQLIDEIRRDVPKFKP